MITFIVGCFAIVYAIHCFGQARLVIKGQTIDKRGKPLWVYMRFKNQMPVVKDRSQALLLTIGLAVTSLCIGGIMIAPFIAKIFAR